MRFLGIRDELQRLHQEPRTGERVCEDERQGAGSFLSGDLFDHLVGLVHGFARTRARVDGHRFVVVHEAVHFKPADLVVVGGLLQLEASRVTHERQNLRAQMRVVLEERVENEHPDCRGLAGFGGFNAKAAVGSKDHLGRFRRVVSIHLVDVDEILEKESDHVLIDAAQRLGGVLGARLDKSRYPFHEGFPDKLVLTPAVQVDEPAYLTSGNHGEQIQAVGQPHSHD